MLSIDWAGEQWMLCASRSVFWPRRKTLIIADPHFGKAAAFRAAGVPVPSGCTQSDLERLSFVLAHTGAERLIVVGDFFHARAGRAPAPMARLEHWRAAHARLDIVLVRGNHDRQAGDPPLEWGFLCAEEPFIDDGVAFVHDPMHAAAAFAQSPAVRAVLAGHVHPCAILYDVDGTSARAACFHLAPRLAILPAFGSFTGTHPVNPRQGDRIFALADNQVIEIRPLAASR